MATPMKDEATINEVDISIKLKVFHEKANGRNDSLKNNMTVLVQKVVKENVSHRGDIGIGTVTDKDGTEIQEDRSALITN